MAKVLMYGYSSDRNFGGPSVIMGFRELVRAVDPDAEVVCYETTKLTPEVVAGYDFKVRAFPYRSIRSFWKDWLKTRVLHRTLGDLARREFWSDFDSADTVVNVYGICFCSKFGKDAKRFVRLHALKALLKEFSPNLAARLAGKRSVKSSCSYGGMDRAIDRISARYAARWFFDTMIAREHESARQMKELAGVRKDVPFSPDVANMMPVPEVRREADLIGIVTSFQMERQWKRTDVGYIDCMKELVRHIRNDLHCRVLLIPNQDGNQYGVIFRRGDTAVAEEIAAAFPDDDGISIQPLVGRPALELKSAIARCRVTVSPRYHGCVAALTSGVPLLTLGWHCKYDELTGLYGQKEYMLNAADCSVSRIVERLDEAHAESDRIATEIVNCRAAVRSAAVSVWSENVGMSATGMI